MFCPHLPLEIRLDQLDISEGSAQQPFMSSLLKSSQFSSLFHSNSQNDLARHEIVESPYASTSSEAPMKDNLPSSSISLAAIGFRLLNGIQTRTKSFMDLPSLWSSSQPISFPSEMNRDVSTESLSSTANISNVVRSNSESSRNLSLAQLKIAISEFQVTLSDEVPELGDTTLIQMLRVAFSSSESLNKSFLGEVGNSNPSGLDLASLRESFGLIFDISAKHEIVLDAIVNSLEIILAKLQLNIRKLRSGDPKFLRQLLILIEVYLILFLI
jgi:hypothetical protein